MKTIKQDTCPGLSGENILTYEVGLEHDKSIWLRLVKSSGGGFLHSDWISVDAIMDTLRKAATPFTSWAVHKLFLRKSINSPAFLMAVLKNEGLVSPDPKKGHAFVVDDVDAALEKFRARMPKGAKASKKKATKAAPRKAKPK
jgi:hypothetical protein